LYEALDRRLDLPRDLLLEAERVVDGSVRPEVRVAEAAGLDLLELGRLVEEADAALHRRLRELPSNGVARADTRGAKS
jgi:hypothetical protein